ncbi:conserved hypothetical protein [Culex quinquefasciatus]|uniref:Uncharacterized protein n=1 Tax=Culex quinquefasciatus TaxID=7176 RepID=B0XL06_CULQU|nr:conserved hypothetical protein [Culex quinquefasciatus]|eukprot:XP_001870328.1 conserved hypothetical protein [Culex quinquefasciatus]
MRSRKPSLATTLTAGDSKCAASGQFANWSTRTICYSDRGRRWGIPYAILEGPTDSERLSSRGLTPSEVGFRKFPLQELPPSGSTELLLGCGEQRKVAMSPTRNLTDAIRQFQQAEQKVVSVRDAILSLQEPSLCDSRPREQPTKYARADTTSDALVVANHRPQEPAEAVDTEVNPASTGSQNDVTSSAKHNQMLSAVYSCLGQVGGSKTESDPDPARVAKIRTRPGRVHPDNVQEVRIVAEHTPMLPPTVKAHDKRGQPRSCRIHPDDGALQDHQPGRCWPAHKRQRQGWLPTDPPDKEVVDRESTLSVAEELDDATGFVGVWFSLVGLVFGCYHRLSSGHRCRVSVGEPAGTRLLSISARGSVQDRRTAARFLRKACPCSE